MRATILIFLLVAAASFLWLRSDDRPRPVEVPLEDTRTWMERMREPGEILFVARESVAAAAMDPAPPIAPSRTVSTLGPLDEPVEAALVAQPLETRKARIARHRQARSQGQAQPTNANIRDQLSPEELKAALIRGSIEIDDVSWTLSLLR